VTIIAEYNNHFSHKQLHGHHLMLFYIVKKYHYLYSNSSHTLDKVILPVFLVMMAIFVTFVSYIINAALAQSNFTSSTPSHGSTTQTTPSPRPPSVLRSPAAANNQPPAANNQPPAANNQPPAANNQPPAANNQTLAVNNQTLAANNQTLAANNQTLAANNQPPAANNQPPAANNQTLAAPAITAPPRPTIIAPSNFTASTITGEIEAGNTTTPTSSSSQTNGSMFLGVPP
jgi:hypothetical protein